MKRAFTALCLSALCSSWAGTSRAADPTDLSPDDFAYGAKVLTSGDAAAYRATVPLTVYQNVVRGDLGDLRVFNERGELVPHRIERPISQSTVQAASMALPLFVLRENTPAAMDAMRITIESGGTRVDVQAPVSTSGAPGAQPGAPPATAGNVSTGTAALPVASYILDARSLTSPIASFQLSWPENAPDFAGRLQIESSDNLGTWQPVVSAAPIANLHAGSARIIERRVELPGSSAKFWRLSWVDGQAPFAITSVVAEPARDRVDAMRATLTIPGVPHADKRGEFTFDLGALIPVDRVNLELPEQNSVVEVELLTRARPDVPWRPVTRGGFYRLRSTSTDLTNGPFAIAPAAERYWLARADVQGGGLGRNAPTLRVGWLPHDVVFLARGAGPFTLAYGNATVRTVSSLGLIPDGVSILDATLAEPETLGGAARLGGSRGPLTLWSKSTLLWTVLAVGVALLAFMAYRLANELKDKP